MERAINHKIHEETQPLSDGFWIDYPVAVDCLKSLFLLFQQPPPPSVGRDASVHTATGGDLKHRYQGMMLVGHTGNGKTEILRRFKRIIDARLAGKTNIQIDNQMITLHPVVYIETPAMSSKYLFKSILDQMNFPYPNSMSEDELLARVIACLKLARVQMLMLDEFQNILLENKGNLERLMNKLLYISNSIGLSLVLAGTPEIDTAVASYPSLMNRLFPFDIPEWENDTNFQSLLKTMAINHKIISQPPLEDPRISNYIYNLTEGRIGEVTNLLFRMVKTYKNNFSPKSFEEVAWSRPSERRSRLKSCF